MKKLIIVFSSIMYLSYYLILVYDPGPLAFSRWWSSFETAVDTKFINEYMLGKGRFYGWEMYVVKLLIAAFRVMHHQLKGIA